MSNNPIELLAELINLTKKHIDQEFTASAARVFSDSENYAYYKNYALQGKQAVKENPQPKPSEPLVTTKQTKSSPVYNPPTKDIVSQPVAIEKIATELKAPLPSVKQTEKKEVLPTNKNQGLNLEPLVKINETDLADIKKLMVEKYPSQVILDDIPSDQAAKTHSRHYNGHLKVEEVVILSFNENTKQVDFLDNLARAISTMIAPCAVISANRIEFELGWQDFLNHQNLKRVIATYYGLSGSEELRNHFKEQNKNAKTFLGNIPLMLLSDISIYFQNPHLKANLWYEIKQFLSKN